jgi:hypothetical protein
MSAAGSDGISFELEAIKRGNFRSRGSDFIIEDESGK